MKELTPEFFYLPTFLQNSGGFELGVRQDGKVVADVVLPPWVRVRVRIGLGLTLTLPLTLPLPLPLPLTLTLTLTLTPNPNP